MWRAKFVLYKILVINICCMINGQFENNIHDSGFHLTYLKFFHSMPLMKFFNFLYLCINMDF